MTRRAIAIAALALLVAAAPAAARPRAGKTISLDQVAAVATQLAGEPVTIVCESPAALTAAGLGDRDGFVVWTPEGPLPVIHLRQSFCDELQRIDETRNPHPAAYDSVDGHLAFISAGAAVLALTHEAMHIRLRSQDEALVNCTALRNRWAAINAFGPVPWVASAIAYGATWQYSSQPSSYRLAGC